MRKLSQANNAKDLLLVIFGGHLYRVLSADLYAISIEPLGRNNQVIISSERAQS